MSGLLLDQLSRLSDSAGPQRGRNGTDTHLAHLRDSVQVRWEISRSPPRRRWTG